MAIPSGTISSTTSLATALAGKCHTMPDLYFLSAGMTSFSLSPVRGGQGFFLEGHSAPGLRNWPDMYPRRTTPESAGQRQTVPRWAARQAAGEKKMAKTHFFLQNDRKYVILKVAVDGNAALWAMQERAKKAKKGGKGRKRAEKPKMPM